MKVNTQQVRRCIIIITVVVVVVVVVGIIIIIIIYFGGCSGESTRLPTFWPVFKSRRRHHKQTEFVVGSLLHSEGFFSPVPLFSPLLKNQLSKLEFDQLGIRQTKKHYVNVLPLNRYLFIYLYIAHVPLQYVLVIQDQAKLVKKDNKCTWR